MPLRITRVLSNDGGDTYHVLPTLAVTPLIQTVAYINPAPSHIFDNPAQARADYPTQGLQFIFRFYTYSYMVRVLWSDI